MRRLAPKLFLIVWWTAPARAHDIPNARVDRSLQATLAPGRLAIDYEVSVSELTLTQDLRALIGGLPGADRRAWFDRYGAETGPLNAKGLLLTLDGRPLDLRCQGFDLAVEEHPRYTFHYEAPLPPRGRLSIRDTNFAASEGSSRLAVRGRGGVAVEGDDLPPDVDLIPARPVWQLSDAEERRTKHVEVSFRSPAPAPSRARLPLAPKVRAPAAESPAPPAVRSDRLSRLLDRSSGVSLLGLSLIAFVLGVAHAIQPGHGKTLVAAAVVAERGTWLRGALLAVITTLTHTGSVVLVAAGLWWARTSRFEAIHVGLARAAGFLIAAIGLWRLGRHLSGFGEHDGDDHAPADLRARGVVGLGVAGGLVPCWDAVGLIVLAEAVGRLALGLALLLAFGLGMTVVLVAVGAMAARFRQLVARREWDGDGVWEHRLGIASSLVLSSIGVFLLAS
ncbi:MAG: sulfite exporter TauE/SafE family protein [Planctomycetaceae bacterium]|nr:sulfite exporter TauE/SafE family protein [Planctomycetaceae bacterium]